MAADLGAAALLWASAGWQVFPIVPRGKTPFAAGDFCGRDDDHSCGFHCATADQGQLRAWWEQHPDSNIGLTAPDAFVVDEDRVSALREAGIHLPVCPWQVTGREGGGKHYFLEAPDKWAGSRPGARVRNRLEGVEVKGFDKGYVVAAPSVHATGTRYVLQKGGYVPACPIDVANALTEITLPDGAGSTFTTITAGGYVLPPNVGEGERYNEIVRYTAHLYNRGLAREEMWSLVEGQLSPRLVPPLAKTELRQRFLRATRDLQARLGEPRSLPEADRRERDENDELGFLPPPAAGEFPEPPDPVAYEGVLGDCVKDLAPGTDAPEIGLLGAMIAFAGALVPGHAYWQRTNTSSPYIALVGESSVGRKGTAMHRVRDAFVNVWTEERVTQNVVLGGLNSGEALVATLWARQQNQGAIGLLFEEEYARLLTSRGREGSTLDPIMRSAFDGGALENRKIGESKVVMPPYWLPAIIGITPSELGERLEPGAFQSGSANRWLYLAVAKRDVQSDDSPPTFSPVNRGLLREARSRAMRVPNPLSVERAVSRRLSQYAQFCLEQSVGIARDLTRRLHVIAFRIGLVHALVEGSDTVREDHLERALAVTEYSRRSLPWVFRGTLGDSIAELIYRHLLAEGPLSNRTITREICRDPQKRTKAIDVLERYRLIERREIHGRGRKRTVIAVRPEVVRNGLFVPLSQINASPKTGPSENPDISRSVSVDITGQKQDTSVTEGGQKQDRSGGLSIACSSYREHQASHYWDGTKFRCPVCDPEVTG
jgi:hypothetical protein